MSPLRAFFDRLQSKRTDTVKKVIRENYSIILTVGTIDTDFSKKNCLWTILLIIYNYAILANQDWMLFLSCFLLKNDFDSASGVGNYGFLVLLSILFLINFHYNRSLLYDVHTSIGTGIYKYSDEQIETVEMEDFRKELRFQYTLLKIFSVYVSFIGVLAVAGPVIDNKLGLGYPGTYDDNGVNRQLPVPLYFPFDTEGGVGWFIAMAMTTLSGCATCTVIGGASLIFTTIVQFCLIEQKKLCCSMKALTFRAKRMYCKKYGVPKDSINAKTIFDVPEFQECITDCLVENIAHHHQILAYAGKIERLFGLPCFSAILICTVAIALTMIKLNQGMHKVGSSIAFVSVALGELFNMLNLAVYGEYIMTMSSEINQQIYFTPWYRFNVQNKKLIARFLLGTHRTMSFRAYITRVDMEMFSSVVNGAYSFFNFLKLGDLKSLTE